jgi:hypothetical protein
MLPHRLMSSYLFLFLSYDFSYFFQMEIYNSLSHQFDINADKSIQPGMCSVAVLVFKDFRIFLKFT